MSERLRGANRSYSVKIREKLVLKNIKHGRTYSSCEFYPEGNETYLPGYIKVDVATRDILEQRDSVYPIWHWKYAHYARREILNLRAEGNHCKERDVEWINEPPCEKSRKP